MLNNITTAHGFAVTSQIQQSCVKIQTVVLVELQGKGLILKGSAGDQFKNLARASILLLIPPSPMTTQSAIDLVQWSEKGILVTAQFFYVTLLLETNTPFNSVASLTLHPDTIHSMREARVN